MFHRSFGTSERQAIEWSCGDVDLRRKTSAFRLKQRIKLVKLTPELRIDHERLIAQACGEVSIHNERNRTPTVDASAQPCVAPGRNRTVKINRMMHAI